MVRLATADRPDVLCLQEIPVWALDRLGEWSGMSAVGAVAASPTIGPLPSTAEVGRVLTSLDHGLLRSALAGQANAILLGDGLRGLEERCIVLNPRRFRRAQARWLGLDPVARLAWASERRVCHAVRVRAEDWGTTVVANLHATSYPADQRLADAELLRAGWFVDAEAAPGEPVLLCGDFNVSGPRSRTLSDLAGPEWGFSAAGGGIDHVLVRGAASSVPETWPPERRRLEGRLLSDHAPVEVRVG